MKNTFSYRYPFSRDTDIVNAIEEIQERMMKLGQEPEDNGVTYEWVLEQIGEKLLPLEAKIEQLEQRIKELEDK